MVQLRKCPQSTAKWVRMPYNTLTHRNLMTDTAQQIWKVFCKELTQKPTDDMREALATSLREVINQLQQSSATHPAFISCPDLLELCEEIEKL